MGYPLSRVMTIATSAYAGYALSKPGHLNKALDAPDSARPGHDRLARTYGVRDLATSTLVFSGRTTLVRAGMALRIAGDVGDCVVLTTSTPKDDVRRKVAAVTLGWATLNALAWALDERSNR